MVSPEKIIFKSCPVLRPGSADEVEPVVQLTFGIPFVSVLGDRLQDRNHSSAVRQFDDPNRDQPDQLFRAVTKPVDMAGLNHRQYQGRPAEKDSGAAGAKRAWRSTIELSGSICPPIRS